MLKNMLTQHKLQENSNTEGLKSNLDMNWFIWNLRVLNQVIFPD
jgi:hypothetical protein